MTEVKLVNLGPDFSVTIANAGNNVTITVTHVNGVAFAVADQPVGTWTLPDPFN